MEYVLMFLTFVGGLAMFLYGMNVMGGGLEKLSGGKLEKILEKLTSNKIKGVLLGMLVTAVVQSSSATTVMVVGFVNSGIMQLEQAVSVIMGANIGTTVTAWILSLSGIQGGESLFLQLLKPTSFAPIMAIIGVIIMTFMKKAKGKKQEVASILIGFALLMLGMNSMSSAISPLAEVPEFTNILTMFSNPLLGVLVGAAMTGIMQSSSATVGILQALSLTGSLPYSSAIPIILGENIGACVTTLLSSVGANKDAKRAAFVRLYVNIIGNVVFLTLYYSLDAIFDFAIADQPASMWGIAVIHTVFNVATTLLLLPFTNLLVKLAKLTVREGKHNKDDVFALLDERFLSTPSFAIDQCRTMAFKMAELTKQTLNDAIGLLKNYDSEHGEEVVANENLVDEYEDKLGTYLVKLSSQNLTEKDSKQISVLLHCISDIERISDYAVNTMEAAEEMSEKGLFFSDKAQEELRVYIAAIKEIVSLAFTAFETGDIVKAKTVEPLEEVIDNLRNELKKHHVKRLRKGKCTIEAGFILSDMLTNFERIADHCSNIAVCLIQIQEGTFDTHEYINELKKAEDAFFLDYFAAYSRKYALPKKGKEQS